MGLITLSLIVAGLLIVLPIGYFAVIKSNKGEDAGKIRMRSGILFVIVLLLAVFLGSNAYTLLINHDERVVTQRYVNSLIENSITDDEAGFLVDVRTIAYDMDNQSEVFEIAQSMAFTQTPLLLISNNKPKDSEGNVYLYVVTEDLGFCLDVELKPSGNFYDVYAVTVLNSDEREAILRQESFSPIW